MTILDKYIVRTFLSSFAILIAIGVGMYVLSDLLLNLDEYTEHSELSAAQVFWRIGDYYLSNMPLYYSQLAAPMMAVAAAFTFGTMMRNNEQTALVAAGMPLQRLAVPVVICSIGLIAIWALNREFVMPRLASKMIRQHDEVLETQVRGVPVARDENDVIVTALRVIPERGRMERVFLVEPSSTGGPKRLIEADAADYDAQRKTWVLQRGFRLVLGEGSDSRIRKQPVSEYPLRLTPEELTLRRDAQWADFLSLRQLGVLLQSKNLPNWQSVNMSRHVRLTQPLLQAIVLLLVVPYFLTRERANVLGAGGKALVAAGSFYLLMFVSHNVVNDVRYDMIVAWLPIFVFGPIAALKVANIRT